MSTHRSPEANPERGVNMDGPRKRILALAIAAVLTAAIVVPATTAGASGRASAPAQGTNQKCPLGALKKASKPVEITFWHSMNRANDETLQKLTDAYNSSQSDVKVALVNQTTYNDTLTKYVAGLSTGDLPDLVQIEDTGLQQMIDTQSVLPAQACVKADKYDLSGHVQRVVDYYTVDGTLWPMPFNVSNPVFYYNKKAFTQAGLDPNKPPTTLDEITVAAKKLQDAGAVSKAGFGLKTDPWYLEQWLAKAGRPYVNNGNGRKARADKVVFDTKQGLEIFTWMSDMVSKGYAITNPNEGSSQFDNLLGIGNGTNAMTIDTSASLGTITNVLASGAYPNVELGVGPMPGPVGKGGILVGGASLYLSNKSAPAKQAAAWDFAKYLNTAQVQADWAAGTGYVPVVEAATKLPAVKELWAKSPGYKVAYDQLLTGVNNTATAGPVIGAYKAVRDAVITAQNSMFTQGVKPKTAINAARDKANPAMEEYNTRVGG
jgi:sn-glycerol 3-phosphate transport system substrate-binding protein